MGHSIFEITERVELALMSELFFARVGQIIYYIIISVYLFGDLAIYAVGVPKSLATIVAPSKKQTKSFKTKYFNKQTKNLYIFLSD